MLGFQPKLIVIAKEAVLHRHLRTLYRFRNDARPVQPADPIRLQLAGRLFSHGIVCAVLCCPAYRTDKAAVPIILRKIFRNLANDLWLLEPEVVFQWGRFYFRGQPLYRGRLSARIHFVISRSGVRVTPPAPKCVDERCSTENTAQKRGVFIYLPPLFNSKS